MKNILYDSGEMSVGGNRGRVIVRETGNGIAVEYQSLYENSAYGREQNRTEYFREYPKIPKDWEKEINEYGTTEADLFLENLRGYTPYKIVYGTWGGARKGAGRPATGRKLQRIYATDEEMEKLRKYLEELRK